jgi:shikimate kinase
MKSSTVSRPSVTPVISQDGEKRVVFLVGFMGAGKTAVGSALSQRLGWQFEDLDEQIESRAGQPIEQIFRLAGEAAFRMAEHEAIREVLANLGSSSRVVALGGGAFVQPENAELLRQAGFPIVFLDAPVEELWRRCQEQAVGRPLRQDMQQFRDLYQARRPHYLAAALHVDTTGKDVETVAAEIANALRLKPENKRGGFSSDGQK